MEHREGTPQGKKVKRFGRETGAERESPEIGQRRWPPEPMPPKERGALGEGQPK